MQLGERFKKYRKEKGYSMAEVQALTGIPADRLYKWEKGTKPSLGEDILTLEKFLSGKLETVPRSTNSEDEQKEAENQSSTDFAVQIAGLIKQQNRLMEEQTKLMEAQNKLLKENIEPVKKSVETISATTENIWNGLQAISIRQEANAETQFRSLARLERTKDEFALVKASDKKRDELVLLSVPHGKGHEVSSGSTAS